MPEPARPDHRVARLVMMMAAGVAAVMLAIVLALSYRTSPNWVGILRDAIAGLFSAFVVLAAIFWAAMELVARSRATPPTNPAVSAEIEALLNPALTELERTRRNTLAQMFTRAVPRVPLGMTLGFFFGILGAQGADPPDVFGRLLMIAMGGLFGGFWAVHDLGERYRRLYKTNVLPALAARFGALTFHAAPPVDVGTLRRFGLFETFDAVEAEDEIAGSYRDHPIRIVELELSSNSGESRRSIFDGLLIEIVLPRNLLGMTLIAVDRGLSEPIRGLFLSRQADARLQRVRLEDPQFERTYQVYGTDQVEARALLHPAFMVRFLDLSKLTSFGWPRAFAEGNRFTILLPKTMPKNLFEPPSYIKPAADRQALAQLSRDIQAVLAVSDAVIALN